MRVPYPVVDHYEVIDAGTIRGATSKDVLRDPATGNKYIAKLGSDANNDIEVITEFAIFLIGRSLGVSVANGKAAVFRGQLRFLSEYFLDDELPEELVHGMQLFTQLYDDPTVEEVLGDEQREQAMFSVQAIRDAFSAHYVQHGPRVDSLFADFVAMLTHDAVIGVQDRHHENWGVIVQRDITGAAPRFAPLYDSARGLFCNHRDPHLAGLFRSCQGVRGQEQLDFYIRRSRPLVGYDQLRPLPGRKCITHDQLIAAIYRDYPDQRANIQRILNGYDWRRVRADLRREAAPICTPQRIDVILTCLRRRIRLIWKTIDGVLRLG